MNYTLYLTENQLQTLEMFLQFCFKFHPDKKEANKILNRFRELRQKQSLFA